MISKKTPFQAVLVALAIFFAIFNVTLDDQAFSVIPAKAGIHELPQASWIPGRSSATPGMTLISSCCAEKT